MLLCFGQGRSSDVGDQKVLVLVFASKSGAVGGVIEAGDTSDPRSCSVAVVSRSIGALSESSKSIDSESFFREINDLGLIYLRVVL